MMKTTNASFVGNTLWGGFFPGGMMVDHILGWFTIVIETFIRRDFGERYYTLRKFFSGLFLLFMLMIGAYIFSLLNPFNFISAIFNRRTSGAISWLGQITRWYIYLGGFHFLRIWWNNIIGRPVHSYQSGVSWLKPIGKAIMWVLNLILNAVVRLIFALHPHLDKKRLPFALPVLVDSDTFTERFVEPVLVMFVAFYAAASGQPMTFIFLMGSAIALVVHNGIRHEMQRGFWLDIQDSMIEAGFVQQSMSGNDSPRKKANERMMKKTAYEVEKNPAMLATIERNNPTVAEALKGVSDKLKKVANSNPPDEPVVTIQQAA